jgi:isopenicillin-N epimerase
MNRPRKGDLAEHWTLDLKTVFLNHGSFGATPTAIMDEQRRIRALMEEDPVRFFEREYLGLWDDARQALSEFVNADVDGMAFVSNATQGINTVLRSLRLQPGDEIIVPDHSYQACWNAVDFVTERSGAKTVVVEIPFRVEGPQEVLDIIMGAVTDRTVLALIDTVTSPTGMRMPFEELTEQLQSRGVDVLLDAAHGPGIVPLDLSELAPAYCTGNCHKWLCSPKGSAFLHIREDRKHLVRPLNISHGASFEGDAQEKFEFEFAWPGTQDPSAWMCIPKAIEYLGDLVEGGWPEIMRRNHALALEGRGILCEALGTSPPFPDSMVSALASVEITTEGEVGPMSLEGDPFHNLLLDEYGIQVPVMPWRHHGVRYIRISAQLYNHEDEYRYLAEALRRSL